MCLECFQCYVIIDCCLTLKSCTFQPMVALINHLLTYLVGRYGFSCCIAHTNLCSLVISRWLRFVQ